MRCASRQGFTLIELLVVVLIILLVSALVLPVIWTDLMHGHVTEAARQLQAAFVQARAEAVKANAPRGMRLLPDPTYANSATILAYNRWQMIEPGPDYSNGMVTVWPLYDQPAAANNLPQPPQFLYPGPGGGFYPYLTQQMRQSLYGGNQPPGQVLMVEEAPFSGNDITQSPTNPTSWFWNVRIGDKIQIGGAGRNYTIVGPMVTPNPELFVNDGPPGPNNTLVRQYTAPGGMSAGATSVPVEYLFVVNGQDDDNDGFVDNGWDGYDSNWNGAVDDMSPSGGNGMIFWEWSEIEQWVGAEKTAVGQFTSYSGAFGNSTTGLPVPAPYVISRRPVPSPNAQETALSKTVVIDATTWNTTAERSRLPIDPRSFNVDVMFNPNGSAILTTAYSTPTAFGAESSFYHFWIAERQDVQEAFPQQNVPYLLPMGPSAVNYPSPNDTRSTAVPYLKGERALVTLFTRTGNSLTNSIEFFNGVDLGTPFYDAQLGNREAK